MKIYGLGRRFAGLRKWAGLGAVGLALSCGAVQAQDSADANNSVTTTVKSLPSEIMPLTTKDLLLDIVNTGRHLIAVGDRGAVVVSNDGLDWAQVQTPTRSALTAVAFADADNGWAVGHDAVILHTTDGGRTWALQNFDPALEKPLLDVVFLDAQRGFAVGAYGLFLKTVNGGESWTPVETDINPDEWHFNSITRLNDGSLLIAGEAGTLALSTDAGETWTKLESPYDSSLFGAVAHGEHGALIYGLRGNVFVNEDVQGGGEWKPLTTNSVASMFGAAPLDNGGVALVGLNGNTLLAGPNLSEVRVIRSKDGTPLSAAIEYGGELLAVGESGIQHISLH